MGYSYCMLTVAFNKVGKERFPWSIFSHDFHLFDERKETADCVFRVSYAEDNL